MEIHISIRGGALKSVPEAPLHFDAKRLGNMVTLQRLDDLLFDYGGWSAQDRNPSPLLLKATPLPLLISDDSFSRIAISQIQSREGQRVKD